MKYGHVAGTKQVSRTSQAWYDAIAEENIARVEAEQAALEALTALAKDALPGQDARIDQGAALVAAHDVWPLTDGTFIVGSASDTVKAYLVQRPNDQRYGHGGHGWTCECKDFQHRGGLCKHIAASMLSVRMGADYNPSYN